MGSLTDEEEEEEESGRGNRLLGFMFGNVDNSGDLDVDYLDEDAKEHLAALADKLGSSLTDIDLSVKSSNLSAGAAEQDYEKKAEDAVDYEDIDEQYEGPEIQASGEEDHLLPKKEYFSSQLSLPRLDPAPSAFDDDDYDEIEEEEAQTELVIMERVEAQDVSSAGQQDVLVASVSEEIPRDGIECGLPKEDEADSDLEKCLDEEYNAPEEPQPGDEPPKLPILYVEDGTVILRFSEIFGVHKPLKKGGKQEQRYSVFRDKYKSLNISHIVEEDEEAFLKSCAPVSTLHPQEGQHGSVLPESSPCQGGEEDEVSTQSKQQGKNCCLSAEPLGLGSAASLSAEWQPLSSPKFYSLDQQDWEEQIVWDNSAAISETSMEGCDTTEIASRVLSIKETEQDIATDKSCIELPTNMEEKRHYIHRSHVVLESFKVDSYEPGDVTSIENRYHPQLLRLESQRAVDESDIHEGGEKSTTQPLDGDTFQRFDKLTLQNKDITEGYWLDDVIWEEPPRVKPKLILDLQDKQMLFELSDHMDSENLRLHAAAMIISPSPMPRVSIEMLGHGYQGGWQFKIANDKFYSKGKVSQQLQQNSSKRSSCGIKVHHSAPAIKLQTMKFKLSNKDLANFHRPKALWYPHDIEVAVKEQGKLSTPRPMKIILKSLGGKGTKLHVDADETISSVKAKASKKLDFKLSEAVKIYYLGKELEDLKSLASQNVQPNSLLHLVRTRIHLLPRAQRIPGDNKSLRPPGAFKKKSDLSVKDGHFFLMEYCEERPLLLSNPGMGANLCSYYQKSSPSDQTGSSLSNGTSFGNAMTLEPSDKSPFLGDIRASCRQSALITNMYKAPVFPHKVPSTDFLLVRSAKGKLSLRRIDRMAVVGQQEPLMEVFSPGSKNLQAYMLNRLVVYVYREFREAEKRGVVPWVRVDELTTLFPNLSETIVRKRLKECAVLRRDAKGHLHWSKKRDFTIPSEEDLKKWVIPENVCAYESMQAGMYRLKHLGITRLTLPAGVSAATSQLPDEAIALAAASHIERELQITPWSLSGNFVACLNQDRENIERLEITGVGDPSGRGLGFSYVRATPKAPVPNALTKKKAAAGRGGTTVTGTDADLRRLSMEAAREVLAKFNVPDEQIAKLTRWHRIAMIRKLSSEQAASGVKVDPTTISKYARGQRMSFLQLQQQTREKCQEIWDRQMQSLSAFDADYNQSDTEENSDLDSFAGDLENLLDAEEFEDADNYESKHEKLDGVKGLKMRRRPSQTQAEEEIEDEAAEAAELCRLLVDDDLTEQKKKKPKAPGAVNSVPPVTKMNSVLNTEDFKKPKKVQPNGSFHPKEDVVAAFKEGELMFVKKHLSEKKKPMLKNDSSNLTPVTPRIKIVAENSKSQIFKEKKSARESFVCGACGQLGHMKTNKHCPKYREGSEALVEAADFDKASGKSISTDMPSQSQQKTLKKRTMIKRATNAEPSENETFTMKAKVIPVKIKCGSTEKYADRPADGSTKSLEPPSTSDVQAVESDLETASKVKKIKVSTKTKAEDVLVEARMPSLVIRSPAETEKSEVESQKASLVTLPSTSIDKDRVLSRKPSIVIRPPAEKEREQAHKKVVFKRSKEVIDLDQVSLDGDLGFEYRKTKKIVELASFDKHGMREKNHFMGDSTKKKEREDRRWLGEEGKRTDDRLQQDMSRKFYRDGIRMFEEQDRLDLRRYEEGDWNEELKPKKNKKKKRPESIDVYLEDSGRGGSDKRIPERVRGVKRRPVAELGRYGAEHASAMKRRRGGEVGLANILEGIVDALKANVSVSYLFLLPVSKKIAPDYYDIIKDPMDLSTIRDKARKMEYRNREEFRHDVCQITINAHKYNDGRNPEIPPLADQLLELCDFLMNEHDESLTEAEERIEPLD